MDPPPPDTPPLDPCRWAHFSFSHYKFHSCFSPLEVFSLNLSGFVGVSEAREPQHALCRSLAHLVKPWRPNQTGAAGAHTRRPRELKSTFLSLLPALLKRQKSHQHFTRSPPEMGEHGGLWAGEGKTSAKFWTPFRGLPPFWTPSHRGPAQNLIVKN